MVANWYGKDKFNKRGGRTLDNTNRTSFNCGGYALETYNWYCPYNDGEYYSDLLDRNEDDIEEAQNEAVAIMLKEFRGTLRLIQDVSELKDGEYAIAFKMGEGDFHFAKRNSKGVWFHKRGNAPKIERMTKERVLYRPWHNSWITYDSTTVLFAKKRN